MRQSIVSSMSDSFFPQFRLIYTRAPLSLWLIVLRATQPQTKAETLDRACSNKHFATHDSWYLVSNWGVTPFLAFFVGEPQSCEIPRFYSQ